MESDEGKLFIGGIAWDTTEDTLRDYFGKYGDVSQAVIMKDKTTGRPRGFGFIVFSEPSVLDSVLQDRHTIDGRTVEAKRALSREEQQASSRTGGGSNFSRGGGNIRTKKIFVGGLPSTLTEEGFRQYFENYGIVTDVVIMYDQNTQRPRGFGFISFETEDAVDRVLHKTFHDLDGKLVEVKRALPKDAQSGGGGGRSGYQGYGGSGTNTNSLDARMEGSRFGQPQSAAGGFPPYSGYGAAGYGYGYGVAGSGIGYGGYGAYGGASSGFAGGYGNPSGPSAAGYGGARPGALRNTWSNQTPSGYAAAGGYGAGNPWGAPGGGGATSAPTGPAPNRPSGYGNQVYAYGHFSGSDGLAGYGAAGGRAGVTPNSGSGAGEQGSGIGYMGSGFGESNGNSGYPNSTWRSDPSQAAGGYGGGYGGAQPRQT